MRLKWSCFYAVPRPVLGMMAVLLALMLAVGTPLAASAHPLGNFTINRYSKLTVGAQQLQLFYVLDMAEIPAHGERAQIDTNGDGSLSTAEVDRYRTAAAEALLQGVELEIDGTVTPLELQAAWLSFPNGQAGLPTLRLELTAQTSALRPGRARRSLRRSQLRRPAGVAGNHCKCRAGCRPGARIGARGGSQPRTYDLSAGSPQRSTACVRSDICVANGGRQCRCDRRYSRQSASCRIYEALAPVSPPASSGRPSDPFADLIAIPQLGLGAVLLALAAALGWGAIHAMSPGHGKTLVAAYLVGAHGTARHALFLGLTTTITHTAGVFALGFVTLALSRYVLPEQLYPWLSAASGILVVVIGLSLARRRLFGDGHPHAHDHHHDRQHHYEHDHDHGHTPCHEHGHNQAHAWPRARAHA